MEGTRRGEMEVKRKRRRRKRRKRREGGAQMARRETIFSMMDCTSPHLYCTPHTHIHPLPITTPSLSSILSLNFNLYTPHFLNTPTLTLPLPLSLSQDKKAGSRSRFKTT
ncbi:hypothetical protein E2C01_060970 [Portunus trituberculatus]|uniref:Uncharacterized protein n=1 Tax=Portunus trituberculatus TaxID=210409 RepID=A0A5B7HBZ2_PORTR|nr:hypothetical protein [Portunus trituberculatus]